MSLKITSAEVAANKFFLRELIQFFIEKRRSVFGDSKFIFSVSEFKDFLRKNKYLTVMNEVNFTFVKEHLALLQNDLYARDKDGNLIIPATKILKFKKIDQESFFISESTKENLENILKYIDTSLSVGEKSLFVESNFTINQDQTINFLNKSIPALETKERAIFNCLRNKFDKACTYDEIFTSIANAYKLIRPNNLVTKYENEAAKIEFVNNGIKELRKKLFKLSGNPNTIETLDGRNSTYKLIY